MYNLLNSQEKQTRVIIEREFSTSLMNATKWAEFAIVIEDLPLTFRIKWVDVSESHLIDNVWAETRRYFECLPFGPFPTMSIEWIEMWSVNSPSYRRHKQDFAGYSSSEIMKILERRLSANQIPFVREDDRIRIIGYIRYATEQTTG